MLPDPLIFFFSPQETLKIQVIMQISLFSNVSKYCNFSKTLWWLQIIRGFVILILDGQGRQTLGDHQVQLPNLTH